MINLIREKENILRSTPINVKNEQKNLSNQILTLELRDFPPDRKKKISLLAGQYAKKI